MFLSVVTVIRNDIAGLFRTAASLKAVIGVEVEWLVVDSSDIPVEKALRNEIQTFTYVYVPPEGIYSAMNIGSSIAEGEWVWFLNAGDELSCSPLELIQTLSKFKNTNGVAFSVNILSKQKRLLRVLYPEKKKNTLTDKIELHTNHQGFIFNRSCLDKNPYKVEYRYAADTELIDKLANSGQVAIEKLAVANFYINGRSARNYRKVLNELDEIRPRELSYIDLISREWSFVKTLMRRFIY